MRNGAKVDDFSSAPMPNTSEKRKTNYYNYPTNCLMKFEPGNCMRYRWMHILEMLVNCQPQKNGQIGAKVVN